MPSNRPFSIPAAERRVFAARLSVLPATAAFVAGFCARHDIAHDDALRLTLIVEELFTNSVMHGYGGESDAPIELALATGAGEVTLVYDDAAPPFDPLARSRSRRTTCAAPLESRPVGGTRHSPGAATGGERALRTRRRPQSSLAQRALRKMSDRRGRPKRRRREDAARRARGRALSD